MTTSSGPAIQPEPSDAEAAGAAGDPHDRRPGRLRPRDLRAAPGSGGPTSASGPRTERERVDPPQRVQELARRRSDVVQGDEDRRALDRLAQLARVLPRQVERDRAEHPRDRSARGRRRGPRRRSSRRAGPLSLGEAIAQVAANALERDRAERARAGSRRPPRSRARTATRRRLRAATGASRAPIATPATKPASGSAERTRPRSQPIAAMASAKTTIPMSMGLTGGSAASGHYFLGDERPSAYFGRAGRATLPDGRLAEAAPNPPRPAAQRAPDRKVFDRIAAARGDLRRRVRGRRRDRRVGRRHPRPRRALPTPGSVRTSRRCTPSSPRHRRRSTRSRR